VLPGSALPRLELLGGFRLIAAGDREIAVSGKKNRALLAILALAPGCSVSREAIAGLLWSDRGEQQARNSLRQNLLTLRSDLEALDPSPLILQDDLVKLDLARISIDVLDFFNWRANGDLATAAALFKGPLFAGLTLPGNAFEDWLREQRDTINGTAIAVLEQLAGPQGGAQRIANAKKLVSLDPLREASHRLLMAAYAAAGERGLALKQYEICRDLLKQELGVAPAQQTEDDYKAILNKQPIAAVTAVAVEPPPRRAALSKPAVVVLPFANLSNDPNQQYLSDGIGADITSALSRFHSLLVVAGNSALRFSDANLSAAEIGAKLGVGYLLTGSVRNAGDRIRISVQLIAAETGAVVWAQHYDRAMADVFAVQDELTSIIASTLTGHVEQDSASRVGRFHPSNVAAYDLALRGFQHQQLATRKDTEIGIDYLERAIALDPNYAEAYSWLASANHTIWQHDYEPERLQRAIEIATRGVNLDPHSARGHVTLGSCLLYDRQFERAEHHHRRALAVNPANGQVLAMLGMYEAYMGRLELSAQHFAGAFRLSPYPPQWFAEFRSVAEFTDGRYEEACPGFETFIDRFWDAMFLASAYGHLGRISEAKTLFARYRQSHPRLTFFDVAANEPFAQSADRDRLLDGLRKAAPGD
jgi:TolB-like protein